MVGRSGNASEHLADVTASARSFAQLLEPPWYGPVCPVVWELRRASALNSVA